MNTVKKCPLIKKQNDSLRIFKTISDYQIVRDFYISEWGIPILEVVAQGFKTKFEADYALALILFSYKLK